MYGFTVRSGNILRISGITYTLKEADPAKTTTVTVNNDTDAIYQSVVDFVDMYNDWQRKAALLRAV